MSSPTSVTLVVTFGPTRSAQLPHALRLAHRFADGLELIDGRHVATFELDTDPAIYAGAAQLLRMVGAWRSTVAEIDTEPERISVVEAMTWCAHRYLRAGGCTFRYYTTVPDRCRSCPLFGAERARDEIAATRAGLPPASEIPDHLPDDWS